MRILCSMTFRAIAGSVGAAALVLTLASVHRAPAATQHATQLAFSGGMHCSPYVCGG